MTTDSSTPPLEGIAIIGMAGKFPGAPDLAAFWDNLVNARESITTFDRDELADEELKDDPDYVPKRGIIDKPEWFDANFFGMKPKETEATDPQQRVFLEVCWHALEDAAVDPSRAPGPIGVYAGMSNNSYYQSNVEFNTELRNQVGADNVMIGNEKDYLATRVAYKLNLRGPALNIYTACSTSLVAVCQAVSGLQSFQCDVAIAGGASIKFPQQRGYVYQEGSLYSADGHCRSFDEKAQGTIFSNGVGAVVLKRAEDAVRDGDRIYAIIKGAALNNDGSEKSSFTAPSVSGHAEVISLAQALGGIEPDTIDYIEAHGTATPIGDPIEISGLTEAFRAGGCERNQFCAIGSAKSNVGHMDAAAGVAGLIKTALAIHHQKIPASLHFTKANPALGLEESPFYVISETKDWQRQDHPRRAGVSAFGLGGTNAHVVLEEAPEVRNDEFSNRPEVLILSAKDEAALAEMKLSLARHLENNPALPLSDVAATLQIGRQPFAHRLALAAASVQEAVTALRGAAGKDYFTSNQHANSTPVAFLFPGQGSQHIRMGRELYDSQPAFRHALNECTEILNPLLGVDLRALMHPAESGEQESEQKLAQTLHTQPALFAVEYSLARLLMSWGLQPSSMLGHSIGEYVAACLAGVMSLPDALKLVAARGRLLWECPAGAMLGVRSNEADLRPHLIPGVDIAAINSPNLLVISGEIPLIEQMETKLAELQISSRRLVTSHAFHSAMTEPMLEKFRAEWFGVQLHAPSIPYVSNVTGRAITAEEATSVDYWLSHIRQAVRFTEGLETLLSNGPLSILEVGPGQALSTLAKQHPNAANATTILSALPSAKEAGKGEHRELMQSIGRLWLGGTTVDWTSLHGGQTNRVSLPLYPFQRQPYCAERFLPPGTVRVGESALLLTGTQTIETKPVVVEEPIISTPAPLPVQPVPAAPVISRKEHLLAELRTQLHKASGIDISTATEAASFFDLGFDSLFLTQASIFLKKHFGVKITFRQIAEELGCLDALSTYLDETLPADKFQPAAPVAIQPLQATSGGTMPSSPVADRLALIEQTIAALRKDVVNPAPEGRAKFSVTATAQNVKSDKKIAFGPFRPIQTAKDGTLTEQQRDHLDTLLAAYIARTKSSKAFVQKNRHHFADPRAVAGFNHLWKEAVYPLVVDRSEGGRIWDIDGNEYIDITQGFGVGFLGHRAPFVIDAVKAQLDRGIEIGPTSPLSGEVAELFLEFTGHERVSFCNTGSEAIMAAIRTSRTVTGRDKIVMFAGAYHGIMDEVLVRPMLDGDQLHTIPIAPGIPEAVGDNILVLDYDNPESLEIIRDHAEEIAAVLVETVQSRRPELQPAQFLHDLRKITADHGVALIIDETVNGFRIHQKGACGWFGIEADIATYGKIIGGGIPIGVVAGKRKYLDALDGGFWQYGDDSGPEVGVTFFAGTFVRHPMALAAAKAVLLHLKEKGPGLQEWMNERTSRLVARINQFNEEVGVPIRLTHFSSYFFVNMAPQLKYTELFFHHLRLRGIHAWAGRSSFLCTAHTDADIEQIIAVWKECVLAMQQGGFLPMKEDVISAPVNEPEMEVVVADMSGYAPLTPAQRELFLAASISEEASIACHESLSLVISGQLQVDAVHGALGLLLERHDSLRASFDENGEGMTIAAEVKLPMPILDLSALTPTEQELRFAEIRKNQFLTPFSLDQAPLLRAALLVFSPEKHILMLTAHHIACDGWSFGVLVHELPEAYQSALLHRKMTSAPAPRFDAHAADQALRKIAGEFDEERRYWLERLSDPPAPLLLPTDLTGITSENDTVSVSHTLSRELFSRIKTFGKERRLTLFHILLGTWDALLYRLSGQTDFLVGVPFCGQAALGQPSLVGHCVQFLPMRTPLDGSQAVGAFYDQVRRDVMDALEHQNCTLGEILDELKGLSSSERQGFVPTAFSLEPMPKATSAGGLDFDPQLNPKLKSNFQLTLYAYQGEEELKLLCAARSSLFKEETIQRWLGHFENLLGAAIENPTMELSRLPLMTAMQRASLIQNFNAHGREFSSDRTLHGWFELVAADQPDAIVLTCDGINLTYNEVNRRANQVAHALIGEGVKPGSLVGMCLDRDINLVPAILGILKAGAAYLPIDLSYPADRLAFMLEDANAPVLLTHSKLQDSLPQHRGATLFINNHKLTDGHPETNPRVPMKPEDAAYVIYTSGSTGKPKGCVVTHANVTRLMLGTEHWYEFNKRDVWTLFHSPAFDFSVWEIWGALLYGGRLVVVPYLTTRSTDEFYKLLVSEKVTVLNQTPSAFRQLIAAEEATIHRSPLSLRYVIFGGEALETAMLRPWFDRHGDRSPQLVNMYGITETTVHVTYRPITSSDLRGGSVIGVPIPDLQVYVLDGHLEPVPEGVMGEMFVGGAGLAKEYLNRPELTEERFIPDHLSGIPGRRLYRTGDLARLLPGRDIEYLGRIDHQVKIRGFRIEMGEIETVLRSHPDVREALVLAREEADGEKFLIAYVVPGLHPPVLDALRKHLRQKLPDYMVPAHILLLDQFPLTENGKLDRSALPEPSAERPRLVSPDHVPPQTETQIKLAEIWTEVLKISRIGAEDNFFDIGGTSLHGLRLFNRIRQEFSVALPLGTLFRASTLEKLAAVIDTNAKAVKGKASPITCIQPAGDELPFFGIHGGDGGALFYKGLLPRLGSDRPIFTIEAPALTDESIPIEVHSIEQVAAEYIHMIRTSQRRGPYVLGGYSYGGIVAYEMAQQLIHMGEEVPLVVLFDTENPNVPARARSLGERISVNWRNSNSGNVAGKLLHLGGRFSSGLIQRMKTESEIASAKRLLKQGVKSEDSHMRFVQMREANTIALESYKASPLRTTMLLFRSAEVSDKFDLSEDYDWTPLVDKLVINHVPGKHLEIFDEPNVSIMADKMRHRLDEILSPVPV